MTSEFPQAHGTLGRVVMLRASLLEVGKHWQVLLSLWISHTWGDRDMAEENGARPTPEKMRLKQEEVFSWHLPDPVHRVES